MNAILKGAIEQFEKLSPQDQKKLAREMEQRAYDMWLDAELQKGIDSLKDGDDIPAKEVFARLRKKYGG